MDSQYTPTYHRLWNRDFTLLTIAETLLCVACYMTIPLTPLLLTTGSHHINGRISSIAIIAFVAGMCLSGFFGSWLIQRYRRNKVFLTSALCLGIAIVALSLFDDKQISAMRDTEPYTLSALCFVCGAMFGNAKRVLSCTLLIDKTESRHRTDANYAAICIARIAIGVGPLLTISLRQETGSTTLYIASAATAAMAALIVMCVKFPFRAPEEGIHIMSTDRFFLSRGWNVALVIALTTAAMGLVTARLLSASFCIAIVIGLVIASLVMRHQSIKKARYTSAVGNAIALASVAAMSLRGNTTHISMDTIAFGLGTALCLSEQLYKLLEHSDHCQRSTAESTYFLSSDGGFFLGIAAGGLLNAQGGQPPHTDHIAFGLLVTATVICSLNALKKKKEAEHHA